jgi:8-oxo-dGTP pyrophosphatase MutT (NUDIX family)
MNKATLEKIRRALKNSLHQTDKKRTPRRIPSAVLIPLLERDKELHLLFIRKVDGPYHHSGQVSFPGGAYEEKDPDLLATALRETWEEVGASPENWEILGKLEPVDTLGSPYTIHPFVASLLKSIEFTVCEKEVDCIFTVPLRYILQLHPFPIQDFPWKGKAYKTFLIRYENQVIWGATARILDAFCNLLKQR